MHMNPFSYSSVSGPFWFFQKCKESKELKKEIHPKKKDFSFKFKTLNY